MHLFRRVIYHTRWLWSVTFVGLLLLGAFTARAQGPVPQGVQAVLGPGFTYQGQLKKNGSAVNDNSCSLTFTLWDSQSNLTGQVGISQTITPISVSNGLFTVIVNGGNQFGASPFSGQERWLQVAAQCAGDVGPVTLSRQPLSAAPYALFSAAPWLTSGANIDYLNGNVGVGTANPTSKLEIAAQNGLAITGFQPFLTLRDTNASNKRAVIQSANGDLLFYPDSFIGGNPAVVIKDSGHIGIGPSSLYKLTVRGTGSDNFQPAIGVQNSSGQDVAQITENGLLWILGRNGSSTTHACFQTNYLADCSSAAEYVPTRDTGSGFPETGDLVSMVPDSQNPYDDAHAPFVVAKAAKSCDDSLLGYIVNPASGADGKKINDHYLPLAIYGYFPAKVTPENGEIKRGDAIASSSGPGYGMKATRSCKIIGYALEDADQTGTVQVFARDGESAGAEVGALRAQLQIQSAQLAAQQKQLDLLAAKITALEQNVKSVTLSEQLSH
jgi:hypothetical protein